MSKAPPDVTETQPAARPEPIDPEVAADEESPGEVVRTFAVLALFAGLLLLIPRQFVSAGIMFATFVGLVILRRVRSRRSGT